VAFSSSMRSATQPEDYTRGRLLAEEVMELATKKKFSEISTGTFSCATIGANVPSGYNNCTCTPKFISFNGSSFSVSGTATNYIQIGVSITTPQGNTFESTGMVTNHVF